MRKFNIEAKEYAEKYEPADDDPSDALPIPEEQLRKQLEAIDLADEDIKNLIAEDRKREQELV